MTSRDLVYRTLDFQNTGRAPRQMWVLGWADIYHHDALHALHRDYPSDFFGGTATTYQALPKTIGHPEEIGEYIDPWGCVFTNAQRGVIGEVKKPIIPEEDEDWDDLSPIHIPYEWLTFDIDEVNRACGATDKFVISDACPRPFEQLQFIRGTQQLYMDLMDIPSGLKKFMGQMHAFHCELLEKWAKTDVDGLGFMDDWGAQSDLLINPVLWREIFKPMYKDFIDIAHRHGKRAFMHSDGHTLRILPELIEIGLDAANLQLFCMGLDNLAPYKGQITFWGEIDRQHLLPFGTKAEVQDAVRQVHETLWQNGGCIAQCEFGAGAKSENVRAVFEEWDRITK